MAIWDGRSLSDCFVMATMWGALIISHERHWVEEVGSWSAVPVAPMDLRLKMALQVYGRAPRVFSDRFA